MSREEWRDRELEKDLRVDIEELTPQKTSDGPKGRDGEVGPLRVTSLDPVSSTSGTVEQRKSRKSLVRRRNGLQFTELVVTKYIRQVKKVYPSIKIEDKTFFTVPTVVLNTGLFQVQIGTVKDSTSSDPSCPNHHHPHHPFSPIQTSRTTYNLINYNLSVNISRSRSFSSPDPSSMCKHT